MSGGNAVSVLEEPTVVAAAAGLPGPEEDGLGWDSDCGLDDWAAVAAENWSSTSSS